jgi:acyl-CoA thioester hydrolase
MTPAALPAHLDLSATVHAVVPFHDADPAGVAWHGNYFKYFDLARCALLDQIGYDYREMVRGGHYWPVVETGVKYVRPLPYHAHIVVVARLIEWEFRLKISYEITVDGARAAVAHTTQVAVIAATGEMQIGSPDALRMRLHAWFMRHTGGAS